MTEDPLEYGVGSVNGAIRPLREPIRKILRKTRWNKAWESIRDKRVSGKARWLFICLATFANKDGRKCFPSNKTLCELADISPNCLRKYRTELVEKEWIGYQERIGPKGQTSHEYTLFKICTGGGSPVEHEISMYLKDTIIQEHPSNVIGMKRPKCG